MAFSKNTSKLIGQKLRVNPVFGNGWGLYGGGKPKWLETPKDGFDARLTDVLWEKQEPLVLICELSFRLSGHEFKWGALIARSDPRVDLRKKSVHCNLILSKAKPSISPDKPYPDPEFVTPNAEPYVRGFALVSLSS